ncbi:hypothetical protein CEE44_00430 [Candidatus Woesearchaeota archaeon B3_Woes]|nr:MAG: hypothetical protein CEE44_00430 [Candidatus Woesearchaeota archaeon B3_Woes]
MKSKNQSYVAYLSSYPPRECGIATFTKDLTNSMNKRFNPQLKSKIIAINDNSTNIYNYNKKKVIMQINEDDIEKYINMAKEINQSKKIKIVNIQHEFGLFGGDDGNYLIPFLETLEKPVVITFHSVVPDPDESRKKLIQFIVSHCSAVIVMANKAIEILREDYEVDTDHIHVVPHGIPEVPFQSTKSAKNKLGLQDKKVLSTFGLINKGKGIEYVIESLPPLVKKFPNLLFLIIGETHPVVRKNEGETYRNSLIKKIKDLGLEKNVKFYNKYLDLQEIIDYLLATDIYMSSALDQNQIVSGTLSYALGCGKAIISTPYLYASEVLSDNKGILVKFADSESITKAIDKILSNKNFKKELEKNAYDYSRRMTWSNVSTQCLKIFNQIERLREGVTKKYPAIKLTHLMTMTDDFGIIQFANHSNPDKNSGYTVDDNARALIATIKHHSLSKSKSSLKLINTYLNFLEHSQNKDGDFHNFIGYDRKPLLNKGYTADALGRSIWACGYTIFKNNKDDIKYKAKKILTKTLPLIPKLESPRAKAFTILGLYYYNEVYKDKKIVSQITKLADSLVEGYKEESSDDWKWFEKILTYSNGKLPMSLFAAYQATNKKEYLKIAEESLDFLSNLTFLDKKFVPIGHKGWYKRDGKRAFFDQQPVDTSVMVQTYLFAYKTTKNPEYYDKAILAFNWFLGRNSINQMMYNESTGGCFDGLSPTSVNLNQGAESTIAYLLARLDLEEIKK